MWPAIGDLRWILISEDASPVWIQDNGPIRYPNANVRYPLYDPPRQWFSVLTALGSCPIPVLFDYIKTGEGLKLNQSQSFIYTDGVDDTKALGGSNITLECQEGFANLGGSFTIACTEDNTWTPFPKCVSTSTATSTKATVRCPYTNDTLTFADGYISKGDDLLLYSDKTAEGRKDLFGAESMDLYVT